MACRLLVILLFGQKYRSIFQITHKWTIYNRFITRVEMPALSKMSWSINISCTLQWQKQCKTMKLKAGKTSDWLLLASRGKVNKIIKLTLICHLTPTDSMPVSIFANTQTIHQWFQVISNFYLPENFQSQLSQLWQLFVYKELSDLVITWIGRGRCLMFATLVVKSRQTTHFIALWILLVLAIGCICVLLVIIQGGYCWFDGAMCNTVFAFLCANDGTEEKSLLPKFGGVAT